MNKKYKIKIYMRYYDYIYLNLSKNEICLHAFYDLLRRLKSSIPIFNAPHKLVIVNKCPNNLITYLRCRSNICDAQSISIKMHVFMKKDEILSMHFLERILGSAFTIFDYIDFEIKCIKEIKL